MRFEIIKGINKSIIINDASVVDLNSLHTALDFQKKHGEGKKNVLIISALHPNKNGAKEENQDLIDLILKNKPSQLILIGTEISKNISSPLIYNYFKHFDDAIRYFELNPIADSCILIKGTPNSNKEKITDYLSNQLHDTILEINLSALIRNFSTYGSFLKKETKIMAVVKASAYGSGIEIAKTLSFQNIDYLAVAFPIEGIELRQAGIKIPIVVLNPQKNSISDLVHFDLEPEIYDIGQLKHIVDNVLSPIKVHVNINTGMNRLGINEDQIDILLDTLSKNKKISVSSIFSHLSSSESSHHDDFTKLQVKKFQDIASYIRSKMAYQIDIHILNSSGIVRFPEFQMDMVRLGIGLYGIDTSNTITQLEKVHRLTTRIIQIRNVHKDGYIGYGKEGLLNRNSRIAILPIGYADGIPVSLGLNNYSVIINGKNADILGKVCMDLMMVDVTDIDADVGTKVTFFDANHSIESMAKKANTIAYDILSNISSRVKRKYLYE